MAFCVQVVTNVPGPTASVYLGTAGVHDIVFWAPARSNVALTASLFTYGNFLRVAFQCDSSVGQAEHIVRLFEKEVSQILAHL